MQCKGRLHQLEIPRFVSYVLYSIVIKNFLELTFPGKDIPG